MPYALCPMPYALCPMPYARRVPHLSEKAYILISLGKLGKSKQHCKVVILKTGCRG